MLSTEHSKCNLRRQLRRMRQGLDAQTRARAATALGETLATLPILADTLHIATYLAADAEIDPSTGIDKLWEQGKHIYLPVIQQDSSLCFAPWVKGEPLLPNQFGIGEPESGAALQSAREMDAILLPLVGWDRTGQRLGMGGGFYDRSLEKAQNVIKIGLAYDLQEVRSLPGEDWDVRLDYVLTESGLLALNAATG